MRARPHIVSTRLSPLEVSAMVRALAAPGGGWHLPSLLARWAILRDEPFQVAAIRVDHASIIQAVSPMRILGRQLNSTAFSLNSGTASRPDLRRIAESWPSAAEAVLAVVVPIGVDVACPVPVQATPPAVVREAHPAFRQLSVGVRLRQTVVATRLSFSEFVQVQGSAERAGLDPADFLRSRLVGCDPLRQRRLPRPAARALASVLEEAGRQASNWRQIARSHERRGWPAPPIIGEALATLWELRAAVVPVLARWRP